MPDGFVQQNPRPARSKHDFHCARRSVYGIELHNRLTRGFAGVTFDHGIVEKIHANASAATRRAGLQIAVIVGDAHHAHANQRLHIANQFSFGSCDQNDFEFVHNAGLDFAYTRVVTARCSINPIQQFDFAFQRLIAQQLFYRIKIVLRLVGGDVDGSDLRIAVGDVRSSYCGFANRIHGNFVEIAAYPAG